MSELDIQPSANPDQTPPPPPDSAGGSTPLPQASPTGDFPPPPGPEKTSVLERLGSSPFPRGKFPFLGILASIYEHVSEVTHRRYNPRP